MNIPQLSSNNIQSLIFNIGQVPYQPILNMEKNNKKDFLLISPDNLPEA